MLMRCRRWLRRLAIRGLDDVARVHDLQFRFRTHETAATVIAFEEALRSGMKLKIKVASGNGQHAMMIVCMKIENKQPTNWPHIPPPLHTTPPTHIAI